MLLVLFLISCIGIVAVSRAIRRQGHANTTRVSIGFGGLDRDYLTHVPENLPRGMPVPLVLVFHGGGSTAAATEPFTKFSDLADRHGFIVVYPDAIARNWNDGRDVPLRAQREGVDDVGFVRTIIDRVSSRYSIDPKRVFATGISNGAIFSNYLGAKLSDRIAAIAPVAGALAEVYAPQFKPALPLSVFEINGTDDPLVPYPGGAVVAGRRGRVIGAEQTASLWARRNGCSKTPTTGKLANNDPNDGCSVRWSRWSGGSNGSEVLLYSIDGGGHTWPGGSQYLPKRIIGNVCRDFNATEAIWAFFESHPKP